MNTRYVYFVYAAAAVGFGIYAVLQGSSGVVLFGYACAAMAVAGSRDDDAQRAGFGWFALGHGFVAVLQRTNDGAVQSWQYDLAAGMAVFFFYLWLESIGARVPRPLTTLFGDNAFGEAQEAPQRLRSRYEEAIRLAASQEERHRLAWDLHDSVKQQLFVIQTSAATAQVRLGSDPAGVGEAISQVRDASREAIVEMQALLDQLSAEPLENVGLTEALKKQTEALGFRTGVQVHPEFGSLPAADTFVPGAPEAIFRVAQEALSNVARHARAANVWVWLGPEGERVTLRVRDDGAGFETGLAGSGMGLGNMRRRAEQFGGVFDVESAPGKGTTVRFSVPYRVKRDMHWGLTLILCSIGLAICVPVLWFHHRTSGLWIVGMIGANFVRSLVGYLQERKA